jgi:hypothetical protein
MICSGVCRLLIILDLPAFLATRAKSEHSDRSRFRGSRHKRMRRLGDDPLRPVLDLAPDLLAALDRLGNWFD